MRIGLISTLQDYPWGGTETVWAACAREALHQGHALHLNAHHRVAEAAPTRDLAARGLEVSARRPFRPTRLYLLRDSLHSELAPLLRFQPDVVVLNSGSLLDPWVLPVLRRFCLRCPCPLIFYCHFCGETVVPSDRPAWRDFATRFHSWVFVSANNRDLARRQTGFAFPRSSVLLNAPPFASAALPWPEPADGPIRFASVARLETWAKGQDLLFEVLGSPAWRSRSWELSLFGAGPDLPYLRDLAVLYGLADRVHFVGQVDDVPAVWNSHHLLLLPSRAEGTPLALLEAMMCGRPAVATAVGGIPEALRDPMEGFLAEAASPSSFARALERAWECRGQWPHIGLRAHARAASLHADPPAPRLLHILRAV